MITKNYLCLFLSLVFVVSCGGGGGSSNNDVEPPPAPPVSEPAETCVSYSTNTERCSLTHKGLDRYYLIYTPTTITNNDEAPVLFALHGYGSSAETHKAYTMHEPFANTNKAIVVYAQGYKLETALTSSSSHWNVGAWTIGSTVDDIDFINTVIDLIDDKAVINKNRIYSSGMSNGGFMSYNLACNLSSRIAAIVSVTGSFSTEMLADCNPEHPTPVMQIHGALDPTVPFDGNSALGMVPIETTLEFWSDYNLCNPVPDFQIIDFFDLGISVDHQTYKDCQNDVRVELFKSSGMAHTWPIESLYGIEATREIWSFINQFDLSGRIE